MFNWLFRPWATLRIRDKEIERLQKMLVDPKFLLSECERGKATFSVKHWAAKLLAMSFDETIADFPDAGHFIEMQLECPEAGSVIVTIQKKVGKTPKEAESELGKLRSEKAEKAGM